jgi:hypothetical protein
MCLVATVNRLNFFYHRSLQYFLAVELSFSKIKNLHFLALCNYAGLVISIFSQFITWKVMKVSLTIKLKHEGKMN